MSKEKIKKTELTIGSMVQTAQGIGRVKEIRENRVYLKVDGEKSEIPFPYKDISGIPITVDMVKKLPLATENQCRGITSDQKTTHASYLGGDSDSSFILWKSHKSNDSDPRWNLSFSYGSSDDPDLIGHMPSFMTNIKYLHQLQGVCNYLNGIINLELLKP